MSTSHIQTSQKPVFATDGFAPVSYVSNAVKRFLVRRRVYNATMNELASLSTRELADISITRCDLRRIATEAANDAVKAI